MGVFCSVEVLIFAQCHQVDVCVCAVGWMTGGVAITSVNVLLDSAPLLGSRITWTFFDWCCSLWLKGSLQRWAAITLWYWCLPVASCSSHHLIYQSQYMTPTTSLKNFLALLFNGRDINKAILGLWSWICYLILVSSC